MDNVWQCSVKISEGQFHSMVSGASPNGPGDMEFFFPHLDALPVERTLAVTLSARGSCTGVGAPKQRGS